MSWAAALPAPMARITVALPVTMSPPAQTPVRLVRPLASATMYPRRFSSRSFGVPGQQRIGAGADGDDHQVGVER